MKIDVLNIEGTKVSQVTTKKEFFEARSTRASFTRP